MESVLLVKTALRGYHVYQAVWEPRIGESFLALHEGSNVHDSNAMAVYRHEDPGAIVGHLPREISRTCHYFTRHKGSGYGCSSDK